MSLQEYNNRAFARELVTTGELDPMYTMLYRARALKGDEWVKQFSMYFLMFYESSKAVEFASLPQDVFWEAIDDMYDDLPRGSERRYFRGAKGRDSIQSLQALGSPVAAFDTPVQARTLPAFRTALRAANIVGFGDYFALKWADYQDCIFQTGIDFTDLHKYLPDPPLKCLKTVFPEMSHEKALGEITSWISDMDDPFSGLRKCGRSEAETVACAIPSYLIKHRYKMGDDIKKYREQLKNYPELLELLP